VNSGVLVGLLLAQSATTDGAASPDLQRIRKALEEPAPSSLMSSSVSRDGPVFRSRIEAFDLGPAWKDRSIVPPYVRPWFRADHHEFLEQVTKNRERREQFRGPTLYPSGIDVVKVGQFLSKQIKAANRKRQEQNAREEVERALEELRACRANPARPGC
jgi:hypothetical protein